jgi:site-specific DNA recombinase
MRCAIYTRKSSEEGLEQAFNSLHAQRDACEAYVLSQAGEGWVAVKEIYDDGGWSGGSLDRPALRRLLVEVEHGRIDIVVVYKVDRLTRSLADFAKIVDTFDRYGVSFVSVTQAFNTTSSMGRLTLNVLLSFAQFEREVTGERIRDKIAASKKKGMWMGGNLPLGYDRPTDPATRALRVNHDEAQTVRLIFAQYLKLGSVHALRRWLEAGGIRSKTWTSSRGREIGGAVFARGALFHLLKNRVYLGEITHKGQAYPGAHEAIVEPSVFAATQTRLTSAARRHKERPTRVATMALKGLIFDADGHSMSPTFAHGRKGRLYRYYVSAPLQQGRPCEGEDAIRRVPADAIETLVRQRVERVSRVPIGESEKARLRTFIERVEVHPTSVQLVLKRCALFARPSDPEHELATLVRRVENGDRIAPDVSGPANVRLTISCRMRLRGGRTWITTPDGRDTLGTPRVNPALIQALRSAHVMLSAAAGIPIGLLEAASLPEAPVKPYDRKLLRLAFLAPDIQRDIFDGRQPPGLSLERLMRGEIPASWDEQKAAFG